jgi:predicted CoA-binding protein
MKLHYEFMKTKGPVAIYGLSRSGKGYARDVLTALRASSPSAAVYAVHPSAKADELQGAMAVRSAKEMKPQPALAVIVLKPEEARKALEDAADAGAQKAWLVMNACSAANKKYAESRGMQVVGGCPILFTDKPESIHGFHRAIAKLFGKV